MLIGRDTKISELPTSSKSDWVFFGPRGPTQTSSMGDLPSQIIDLRSIRRSARGDFEHLLQYGPLRYHLLLRFNTINTSCLENTVLEKLYDAVSRNDGDAIDNASEECLVLFWEFIEIDYKLRSNSMARGTDIIKLQVLTTEGTLRPTTHNLHIEFPSTKAVDNTFPGLPTYASSEIEVLDNIQMHIYKVKVGDSIYCLKTVHRSGNEADFVREVSILQKCSHPHIIRLVGLVKAVDPPDKVEGMLINYVEHAGSLRDIKSIDVNETEKWAGQIRDAINYLHENGLVWGDAKAGNVLIDDQRNAVLIDFGGGATQDWVDLENYETPRGDLQGLERIVLFMKERS
jgi:tRNA A-37 threonylcarbamoyl transferase component Bud32